MCGITGTVGLSSDTSVAESMADALRHRGPDGGGVWCNRAGSIALAHRRLAIIDLDDRSAQPMVSQSGRFVIAFNGEIYNYREVREELEAHHDFRFRTEGDTEVILAGFETWGIDVLSRLNGMFAFALVDTESDEVLLCRDRLGVKPLYYAAISGVTYFSSEIGAILAEVSHDWRVNAEAVSEFLWLGYVRSPDTLVKSILKVPPASHVLISREAVSSPKCYWDPSSKSMESPRTESVQALSEELECLLSDSARYRMVSDVPVGLLLSGGLDSTLLASILVRNLGESPKAYTLAVRSERHDESQIANITARQLGLEHSIVELRDSDLLTNFDALPEVFDEPLADTSCIPTLSISKFVSQERKVVLSADGADEVFAGYRRYIWATKLASVQRLFPSTVLRGIARIGSKHSRHMKKLKEVLEDTSDLNGALEWNAIQSMQEAIGFGHHRSDLRTKSLPCIDSRQSQLRSFQNLDLAQYLPDDILIKVDRATMHHSLEGREPFLDYRLVEFAASCPDHAMISNGVGKVLFREILKRHDMHHVLSARKRGFSVPIRKWLGAEWEPLVNEYLAPEKLQRYDWLDVRAVQKLRSAFDSGDVAAVAPVYTLLVLLRWVDHWGVS